MRETEAERNRKRKREVRQRKREVKREKRREKERKRKVERKRELRLVATGSLVLSSNPLPTLLNHFVINVITL